MEVVLILVLCGAVIRSANYKLAIDGSVAIVLRKGKSCLFYQPRFHEMNEKSGGGGG